MVRSVFANVERKTIVLATNILEEAWSISDRIALLGGGRIVAMGPPAAIRERVRREFSIEGIELSV
jgi:ABC-type multidrug transport system ATPase subunit